MAVQINQGNTQLNAILKTLNTAYNTPGDDFFDDDYEGFDEMSSNTINIKVTPATGGTIVNIGDHGRGDLYVIDSEKDLGTELGKILTMHYLRKDANEPAGKVRR